MVDAVFFDLFETLVTSFDPLWSPGPSTGERLGLDPRAFEAEWQARRPGRYTGALPDYRDALRAICHALGCTPDETVIEQLYEKRRAFFAAACARTSDDVIALLKFLRSLELRVGIISNSVPEFVGAWQQSSIQSFVEDVIFSHEVGYAKPQAGIYFLACQRAGVDPTRAIFVGDGDTDELAGAEQVGMRAFWATWFLDQWPAGTRARSLHEKSPPYPRLRQPADLVRILKQGSC